MKVPTVTVIHPLGPDYGKMVINEARYDPDVHTLHPDFVPEWEARLAAMYARADEARARVAAAQPSGGSDSADVGSDNAAATTAEVDATDSATALAAEHGIDLASVVGTGSGGRIIKRDVEALIDG